MSFLNWFERLVAEIDHFFSGRREFRMTLSPFSLNREKVVSDPIIGKKILDEVRETISSEYSVTVLSPVVLELIRNRNGHELRFEWGYDEVGKYHSQRMINEKYHMIYVISGLPSKRFRAICAHELMHAYLYERRLFTDNQALREAMARWMEYKILKRLGAKKDMEHLSEIRTLKFGSGFRKVLEAESRIRGGTPLVEWLRSNREESERLREEILAMGR